MECVREASHKARVSDAKKLHTAKIGRAWRRECRSVCEGRRLTSGEGRSGRREDGGEGGERRKESGIRAEIRRSERRVRNGCRSEWMREATTGDRNVCNIARRRDVHNACIEYSVLTLTGGGGSYSHAGPLLQQLNKPSMDARESDSSLFRRLSGEAGEDKVFGQETTKTGKNKGGTAH